MKVDIFTHICPPKFIDFCSQHVANWGQIEQTGWLSSWSTLWDINKRLSIMDKYEGYKQVLVSPGALHGFFCKKEDPPHT